MQPLSCPSKSPLGGRACPPNQKTPSSLPWPSQVQKTTTLSLSQTQTRRSAPRGAELRTTGVQREVQTIQLGSSEDPGRMTGLGTTFSNTQMQPTAPPGSSTQMPHSQLIPDRHLHTPASPPNASTAHMYHRHSCYIPPQTYLHPTDTQTPKDTPTSPDTHTIHT